MSNIGVYVLRAVRAAVAVWFSTQVGHNVWYAPIVLAAGKALRDRFPGTVERWLPI